MNEKSFLLPGHGTKLLKFKLDRDQGHVRPDPEELRGEHQNEPRFAGGHMDEEMMPPVRLLVWCDSLKSLLSLNYRAYFRTSGNWIDAKALLKNFFLFPCFDHFVGCVRGGNDGELACTFHKRCRSHPGKGRWTKSKRWSARSGG